MTGPSSNHAEETSQAVTVQPFPGDDDGRGGDTAATAEPTGSDTPGSLPGPGKDIPPPEG